MPEFLPFRAVRYARAPQPGGADVSAVCAPPYDVIDAEERAALVATDPHNSVRLILPDDADATRAAAIWSRWRADGTLVTDAQPTFSVYRMHFEVAGRPRVTTGVIGALGLRAPEGAILPHERTLPKAKRDRLELLRATRANLDPIWGLSLAEDLSELIEPTGEPAAFALDAHGVRHEQFRLDDPERVAAVRDAVGSAPLVLADGHHRYETAGNYLRERPGDDGGARSIMALVVELADEQLCVRAIHRLLRGEEAASLRRRLATGFTVRDAGPNTPAGVAALEARMRTLGGVGVVDGDGLAVAVPTDVLDTLVAAAEDGPIRDVDAARFEVGVVPALDGAEVSYRDDAQTVAGLVRSGAADGAVLLRPVTVDQIRAAAFAGVRMPQKTTFFAPKPRTGMVLRSLDD